MTTIESQTQADPERENRARPPGTGAVLPGLGAALLVTIVATFLGGLAPVVGAPVIAILIGIGVSLAHPPRDRMRPGLAFTSKKVLQASVVILGFGLSMREVVSIGEQSLPVLLGTLIAALAMAWAAGRLLGLDSDVKTLVGVGTAICGASAIAATNAVIDADEADVSYSIATIFTFNVVAVLAYPPLGHLMGMSQHSFGLWAGTAINDVSSVVAASTVYGHAAGAYGVVVKLTRTLAIIPISLGIAAWRLRRTARPTLGHPDGPATPTRSVRLPLGRILPGFIVAFAAAVAANSIGVVPGGWHRGLSDTATWMITAALAAIGLSTDLGRIRRAGVRPLMLGAVLWATVGGSSLLLQAATHW